MVELVDEFPGDSTYSYLYLLSPELAADVTSPSGSAGNLGVTSGPVIGERMFRVGGSGASW